MIRLGSDENENINNNNNNKMYAGDCGTVPRGGDDPWSTIKSVGQSRIMDDYITFMNDISIYLWIKYPSIFWFAFNDDPWSIIKSVGQSRIMDEWKIYFW